MSKNNLQFVIPARRPVDALKGRLVRSFPLADDGQLFRRRHFFDTFDWRLYRKGLTLEEEQTDRGHRLVLRNLDDSTVLRWVDGVEMPRFARDLRRGPFRERLVEMTAMRALLPVAEIRSHAYQLRLRDAEEKTVARIELELATLNGEVQARRLPKRLRVLPVRGHPGPARKLLRFASKQLELKPVRRSLLDEALAAYGRKPRSYNNKPRVRLSGKEPAEKALRKILRQQLGIIETNVTGARQYIDTEYLHDLRVAVRRTRTLLGRFKRVFTRDQVLPFKREFAWLGEITGPCRDLDVHLLGFEGYLANLEPDLRPALAPVRQFLVHRHAKEQRRLAAWLDSPRFRSLLANWRRFLDAPRTGARDSERPIRAVAAERIWRQYRKVTRLGGAISAESAAAKLHRLRIECKKLRYLLESCRSLYPKKRVTPFIAAVKRLQENLGDFHDFHVQAVALRNIGRQMEEEKLAGRDTLGAIEALAQKLDKMQTRSRREFQGAFEVFDRPRNRRNARQLFRPA